MFSYRTKLSILRALLTKKSPYYVQFFISGRCNLRCRQCNIVNSNADVREASLDEIRAIATNLRKIGAGIVLLTGGEPFLRRDLPEIVEIFKGQGLDVRLQTAGLKMADDDMLRRCFEAGATDLNISLDSLDPSVQDYINRVPGSWDAAIDAISRVSNIFTESAVCSLGCVMSRFNYPEVPSVLKFATSIGWYLSVVPVHITSPEVHMGFRSAENDFLIPRDEWPRLERTFGTLSSMRNDGHKLFDSDRFLQSSLEFIKTGAPTWRKDGVCDSPFMYFVIRPNGDLAVCCDHQLPGEQLSLVDPDFPKKYKSRDFIERAQSVTKACGGCHYGSYPEVTISVRSPKAFVERTAIVMRSVRKQLRPYGPKEMHELIASIRDEDRDAYDLQKRAPALHEKIAAWNEEKRAKRDARNHGDKA